MSLESVNRLAELTGRTRRTVKDRVASLIPIKDGKADLYESKDALPLIYDLGEKSSPQEEKARLDRLRADKVEIELAMARQEVAPIHLLENALSRIASQINSILDSLPLKIKKRNPSLPAREIEDIRREIVKAKNAASNATIDLSGAEEGDT